MTAQIHVFQRADWITEAACASKPTRWWYSDDAGDQARALVECGRCPVKQECLDTALLRNEVGIWGGTTQAERGAPRAAGTPRKVLVCAECRTMFERDANLRGGRMYCAKSCANRASHFRKRKGTVQ